MPPESHDRRGFLRDAAAALLVSHPFLRTLTVEGARTAAQPSPLKTEAQYKLEASRYDAAVRDITGALAMRLTSDADVPRLTNLLGRAAADLDFQESWMVMLCYADPVLMAWVRKGIRDEATFLKFVDAVHGDRAMLDGIPGASALRGRIAQRKTADFSVIKQVLTATEIPSPLFGNGTSLVSLAVIAASSIIGGSYAAAQDREVLDGYLMGAMIGAALVMLVTGGAVLSGVTPSRVTQTGRGSDLARTAFAAANQRYQQCVASANLLAEPARTRAILACQAKWMAEKAPYVG